MAWDIEEAVVLPPLYVEAAVSRRRWLKKHQDEETGGERRRTKRKNHSEDHDASSSSPEDTEGLCVVSEDMCVFLTWGGGQDVTNSWSHTTANTPKHTDHRASYSCVESQETYLQRWLWRSPWPCWPQRCACWRPDRCTEPACSPSLSEWTGSRLLTTSHQPTPPISARNICGVGWQKTWGNFNFKWHQNIPFH